MKDTVEATAVVDATLDRMSFVVPEYDMPEGGLNIRLVDTPHAQEARMIDYKRFAAEAFSHANKMDKRVWGKPGAKIGFVAAGKNWLDLVHAMSLLGINAAEAERLGVTTYKVGQTWPLDMRGFHDWADGLELIVVIEEKRKLIEVQIKEALFDDNRFRVYGWYKGGAGSLHHEELFPTRGALDPIWIAQKLGDILIEEGRGTDRIKAGLQALDEARRSDNAEEVAARLPYFCSGCPHNSSTKVPEGSRAYAGIGCHYMVQWMDRETLGFTHMGAEGANWIGESLFSKTPHVFQNIGDGTYNHSGIQAIRAAVSAGTTMTYKILFNDAVAMTGGQKNDGGLSAYRIVNEVRAMGVRNLAVVYDEKEDVDLKSFPQGVETYERADLQTVQEKFAKLDGVSVIVYIQTCAAEKRRRRKRASFPDPDKRVFINTDVCEGCGDCGVQSNCVSIVPQETELGRKRAIDQSSCNKDFSCIKGFCPSFVTLEGAQVKKSATAELKLPELPDPALPAINGTWNMVITGVGGTGVVTIGAVLAQAAQIDDKGAGMMEMAGLAQKGGAVHIHLRLANAPSDITAIRVATGEADALIGGDLVVSAGAKTIGLMRTGRTGGVVNSHEIITGDFTRNTEFSLPTDRLRLALEARLQDRLDLFDASELARAVMGDSIFSNMMILGAAWQRGLVPLSRDAILHAIELNGAAAERNQRAFEVGRWAVLYPDAAARVISPKVVSLPKSLDEKIAYRFDHLVKYQSNRYAKRYRKLVDSVPDARLKEAVAKGYHKLLAYKDEYEVARLHLDTRAKAQEQFGGDFTMSFHLAPPMLSKDGPDGRPMKKQYGERMLTGFGILAKLKILRGTPFDPFGRTAERRMERALIAQYEADMAEWLPKASSNTMDALVALAELPLQIRGFGPVKETNERKAAKRREEILSVLRSGGSGLKQAAE
jgi:indolepyruvate ferredoxin oxidoreductase